MFSVGGKGLKGLRVPEVLSERFEGVIGSSKVDRLITVSRLAARIDNLLLQDGFRIYHHVIFFDEDGRWTIIQQGMNVEVRYARRYHITHDTLNRGEKDVTHPHSGFYSIVRDLQALDLTDIRSLGNKMAMLDILREGSFKRLYEKTLESGRVGLYKWLDENRCVGGSLGSIRDRLLIMPRDINWRLARRLYEKQPSTISELIMEPGVNERFIRALSLVAEIIYGEPACWRDPVKYTFTVGGKDGVPYPIDRETYDKIISYFAEIARASDADALEKRRMLRRLARLKDMC